MTNWYAGRRALKHAGAIWGDERHPDLDRIIEAVSRQIDGLCNRRPGGFIPETKTRLYRWPPLTPYRSAVLELDEDLISVTTLQSEAQNSTPTTIASTDYFLEPANSGPPYKRIEIDLSSTAAFAAGDTPQRSISVAGSWAYKSATKSAGTVSSGLASDATATSMVCSNAGLVDVGSHLLIQSEQLFVTEQDFAALGTILLNMAGNLAADHATVTVTVDASHGIVAGEVIRIDAEQMYVERVSSNDLTVRRAYNGTVLASHTDDTAIHINRTLTVERGVNGTTAATHANATAISVYEPPFDVVQLCVAEVIATVQQEQAGYGRSIGAGEGAVEFSGRALEKLREQVSGKYRRYRKAAA